MAFANPNTGAKYNITTLKGALQDTTTGFAQFFAAQLKLANQGNPSAIACVDSYLEPSDQELENLGIHRSQWGPLRKCTDLGLLVHVMADDEATS
jgi:hypothetical protein